jgi:diguanylate cyclase (GGDEF)-like protein
MRAAGTRRGEIWRVQLAAGVAALGRALRVARARRPAAEHAAKDLISRLGLITTCLTIVVPPIAFALLGFYHLQQRAGEQATLGARHLEVQLLRGRSPDWLTQASINVLRGARDSNIAASWISDSSNNVLMFQGGTTVWPEVAASERVQSAAFQGSFNVTVSTGDLILGTLNVLAAFSLLGLLAHYCFRYLPLAALQKAQQLLEAKQQELLDQKSQLEMQNMRFDAALNNMSQALCMFDGQMQLVVCNAQYAQLYQLTPAQVRPGTTLRQILEYRIANGFFAGGSPEDYIRQRLAVAELNQPSVDVRELSDGRTIATHHRPMADGGWVATIEDITEQRRLEARVAHLAHHDALTDLPNRTLLRERLDAALQRRRRDAALAVLCLDLDRFKDINDMLGHPIGDALLQTVANRLRDCVRESDTIARLGGDEFCIVQMGVEQPVAATALAVRIVEELGKPFELGGHQINVGASIGISIFPNDGAGHDELIKNADLALYRAKSEGRSTYRFFEPDMDAQMQARCRLQADMRRALVNGEFKLHYQPVVNLERNEISGLEALLRWQHPELGRVSPAEFIPLAEETNLIVPIGEWVLRQACADAMAWPESVKVAVNLSAVQFKSRHLVETVVSALAMSGLPAHRLELEITESVLLQNNEDTLATLHRLRSLGVRIAMDDFGTGYSSLKIDRCFVADLSKGADESIAILRAVASLGSSLGMATTAEGVETSEQVDQVRAEGCTEMQGYFFSPPRPIEEIARFFPAGAGEDAAPATERVA